jgi:hypothetical protein
LDWSLCKTLGLLNGTTGALISIDLLDSSLSCLTVSLDGGMEGTSGLELDPLAIFAGLVFGTTGIELLSESTIEGFIETFISSVDSFDAFCIDVGMHGDSVLDL